MSTHSHASRRALPRKARAKEIPPKVPGRSWRRYRPTDPKRSIAAAAADALCRHRKTVDDAVWVRGTSVAIAGVRTALMSIVSRPPSMRAAPVQRRNEGFGIGWGIREPADDVSAGRLE